MRVLISGSRGFIGEALVIRLLEEGHEVTRAVHTNPDKNDIVIDYDKGVLLTPGSDPGDRLSGEHHFDAIINLAGEPITASRWDSHKQAKLYDSRINTTGILGNWIQDAPDKPSVFISGSAVGYYGSRQDEILTESSGKGDGFLADLCDDWEKKALSFNTETTRVVAIRTGVVIGKEGGLLKSVLPMFKNGVAGKLGSGQQWMSWISLDDTIRAIMFIMENEAVSASVNLTAPEPVRNADMTQTLAHLLHKPAHIHMPQLALELAMGKRTASEFVLASQRVLPKAITEAGFEFQYPDVETALSHALQV
ncbi:MAG: TIGR01777 family oxidoreductase [Firmicutes bacterium]|jgi:hypothetical protein|nr:TIGR01777 family oxidoreductase [Bacillota bacterium]